MRGYFSDCEAEGPEPIQAAVGLAPVPCLWGILVGLMLASAAGCGGDRQPEKPATQAASSANLVRSTERGPVKLNVKIDRAELTIPEQLELTVAVEAEIGVEVAVPEMGEPFGEFAVAGMTDAEPVQDDFMVHREWVYTLDSFVPGSCVVPAVMVEFVDRREKADGSQTVYEDVVTSEPITVTVKPGLADVKGPVTVPMAGWQKVLLWAIGAVAAMVGIALLARWWRRRRKEAERELPWAMRVPAHEWVLAELDKLAAENLVGRGRVQEFYYRINGLLRRYVELRFGLMAGEQTSEEFIRALQDATLFDENHKEVLRRFVRACDPVKYARHQPVPDEIDWVQAAARDFVLETAEDARVRGNEPASNEPASNEPATLVGGGSPTDFAATPRPRAGASSGSREDVA